MSKLQPDKLLAIGDKVYIDGYTSMAQQNFSEAEIEDIDWKFDPDTGEKFPIYKVGDAWYYACDGTCYSNKESMYYIDIE